MLIADITEDEKLQLITDSQDVKFILDQIGKPEAYADYQGLYVEVGEGEYLRVYGFEGTVPYLRKTLEQLL